MIMVSRCSAEGGFRKKYWSQMMLGKRKIQSVFSLKLESSDCVCKYVCECVCSCMHVCVCVCVCVCVTGQ